MNIAGRCLLFILPGLLLNPGLSAKEFKVAVRAHYGVEHATDQWQATLDVLSEKIPGHRFTLLPIVSLDAISAAAGRGAFDFVLTNPSSYVELKILHGARALVTLNNRRADSAQSRFGSVIFTHARNDHILTLKDLKGVTVMAVSEPAFGGWRMAWLEMLEQGIDPHKDLKALLFSDSKTQPEVVDAIRDGRADVGVVRTDQLERMQATGQADLRYFRILNSHDTKGFPFFHSTPLYPEWAFAAMRQVPIDLAQEVQETLRAITPDSLAASKGQYVGWITALDYSSAERLMKRLRVGPFAGKKP